MFTLQAKLIAGALLLALIGGLITVQHFTQRKLVAAKAELRTVHATLEAERAARAHELKIAKEASDGYQKDLAELRTARTDNPLPAVVCKRAGTTVPAASGTAPGPDATGTADNPPEDAGDRDIGPALDDFATACEANLSQLTRLQQWVRAR